MKIPRLLPLWLAALLWATASFAGEKAREAARGLEENGRFNQAAIVLRAGIADTNTSSTERKKLEFELDRLDRIRLDFPLTRAALLEKLKAAVRDLTNYEFNRWLAEKRFDIRMIDGEERLMVSSVANLFWRYPELNPRRISPKDESFQKALWENCVAIKQAAAREHQPFVLPKNFDVTMTVTVDSNTVPAGEIIRAWLPVPRKYSYQTGFEMIASSSPIKALAPDDSSIR